MGQYEAINSRISSGCAAGRIWCEKEREREKDQQQNQINIISFPIPAEWCCCDTYQTTTHTRACSRRIELKGLLFLRGSRRGKKQQWKMQRGMRRNGRVVKRKRTTALLSTSQVISASHILLLCPTLVSLINQSFMGGCTMSKI